MAINEAKKKTNAEDGGGGGGSKEEEVKKETVPGLSFKKDENLGEWYSQVVVRAEMIEHYDISGYYIIRPWACTIWELMKNFFKKEIEKMGIEECAFAVPTAPLSPVALRVGTDPEAASVTKFGDSDIEMPIAICTASQRVTYLYFSKLITKPQDLPLKVNLWNRAVCRESSNPTPFIRSREFYQQEGHTTFATKEEADVEVLEILELYRRIYEEYLAIPVVKGKKSETEKLAGGLYTTSVEAFIPNTGRGMQGATSHCLGQNFAIMFDITFEDEEENECLVWQNSWEYSIRAIGVMVMVHGDDKGVVVPPKVAPSQVIVVPVPYKDADTKAILDACSDAVRTLTEAGIRAKADLRDNCSPGWKYSHWEMKGVPLRIEIGPKDLANNQVRAVRRDNFKKVDIPMASMAMQVEDMLDDIQKSLFDSAKEKRDACIEKVATWDQFIEALGKKKMILAPWCDEKEVEEYVKTQTKGEMGAAKTLCSPLDQPDIPSGTLCFASGNPAKKWSYWGRSYLSDEES